jgi:capsular polysaccharide biosynthesis protein
MTDQLQQTNPNEHRYYPEDEIELIDILRVIWKWKYFILIGTTICGVLAAIISLRMEKIYSIAMVLRPGILSIEEGGKNVFIDSPQNIKAIIESGAFDNDILDYLKNNNGDNIPKRLRFKVAIPKQSNAIKVKYETSDINQGIDLQNRLSELLSESYNKIVEYYKNEIDMELNFLKSEIESQKNTIQSYIRNVKNLEKRINELTSEIETIKSNSNHLIMERNKLLSKNSKKDNILSALLYTNTIQQNLELSNNYQNELNEYKLKKEEELQKIEESEKEIAKKLNEIKNVQFKKNNIQNIQILQPPTNKPFPIKSKTKRNVILSSALGLFVLVFLSFCLEYIRKHNNKEGMIANKL